MNWQVILTDTTFSTLKKIEKDNRTTFFSIKFAISKIESKPLDTGNALLHEFGNYRSLKDAGFRIIFWIDDDKKIVVITAIYHKKISQ